MKSITSHHETRKQHCLLQCACMLLAKANRRMHTLSINMLYNVSAVLMLKQSCWWSQSPFLISAGTKYELNKIIFCTALIMQGQ